MQRAVATKPVDTVNRIAQADLHGSETILLVEDESAVPYAALEFLKKCGYSVIEARDGLSAVDAASKHSGPIDLVVTDVVMPGMGGGQLAELLAEKHPNIKVLFMSGYAETIVLSSKNHGFASTPQFPAKTVQSANPGAKGARDALQSSGRGHCSF